MSDPKPAKPTKKPKKVVAIPNPEPKRENELK